jgi:hypothetical protein
MGKIAPAATLMRGVGNNTTTANERDSVKMTGPRGTQVFEPLQDVLSISEQKNTADRAECKYQ